MEWFEYLIIIGCVLFVGLVVFFHFYLKKKNISITGDCCSSSSNCNGSCPACKKGCINKNKLVDEYHKECKNN